MTALLQGDHLALVIVQLNGKRDMQRLLLGLLGGRRRTLADGQRILLGLRIIVVMHGDDWRTGLAVPEAEVRQVDVRGIFHRLHEIVAGGGAAVMAFKVQLHPFLEVFFTQQGVQHADHFGTLFINRQGVEVVHLDNHIRADRVRHRAGVFGKLQPAHGAHVVDAVHRP